jgi:methyltransferase (TIGR00027 family)
MREARPSVTAHRVAVRRAAHQIFDAPKVFDDPVAMAIIGPEAAARLKAEGSHHQTRFARGLRAFVAVRSRFAEDELAQAAQRGANQYVILGAGLDTFAYRNPYAPEALRVFEVDYPATQAWKRKKLADAGIQIPPGVTYAPVDFEQQTLADGLQAAGFDASSISFFSWLGVTPYLTDAAFDATLRFIASMPGGSGVAFDYAIPRTSLSWLRRLAFDALARRVAAVGEPFQLFFDPSSMAERLTALGFKNIIDLGPQETNVRYFANRTDRLRLSIGTAHLLSAQT